MQAGIEQINMDSQKIFETTSHVQRFQHTRAIFAKMEAQSKGDGDSSGRKPSTGSLQRRGRQASPERNKKATPSYSSDYNRTRNLSGSRPASVTDYSRSTPVTDYSRPSSVTDYSRSNSQTDRPSRSYNRPTIERGNRAQSVGHAQEDNEHSNNKYNKPDNVTSQSNEKRISRSESDLTRELNERNDSQTDVAPKAMTLVQQFEARARQGSGNVVKPSYDRFIKPVNKHKSVEKPITNINAAPVQNGLVDTTESRTGPGFLAAHSGSGYRGNNYENSNSTTNGFVDNETSTGPHDYNSELSYTANTDASSSTNAASLPIDNIDNVNVEVEPEKEKYSSFKAWKEEQKRNSSRSPQKVDDDYVANVPADRPRSRFSRKLSEEQEQNASTNNAAANGSGREQLLNKHLNNLSSRRSQREGNESAVDNEPDLPSWRRRYQMGDTRSNSGALLPKRRSKEESQLSSEGMQASLHEADTYWKQHSESEEVLEPTTTSRMTDSTYSSGSGEEMARSDSDHHINDVLVSGNTNADHDQWISSTSSASTFINNRLSQGSDDLSQHRQASISDVDSISSANSSRPHSRPVSQEVISSDHPHFHQERELPSYDSYMKSVVERTSMASPDITLQDSFNSPTPKTQLPPPPYGEPPPVPIQEPMDISVERCDIDNAHFLESDMIRNANTVVNQLPIHRKPSPNESVDSMTISEQDALLHRR